MIKFVDAPGRGGDAPKVGRLPIGVDKRLKRVVPAAALSKVDESGEDDDDHEDEKGLRGESVA
jgi:hypothetical protein